MVNKEYQIWKLFVELQVNCRKMKTGDCVCGKSNVGKSSLINALMTENRMPGSLPHRERHRRLIFIISTRNFIWWICRDTDMRRFPKRKDPVGKSDRAVSAYIKTVESSLSSDRHPA